MPDQDDLELRLATTLTPMLFAVATFSIGAMSIVPNPSGTIVDELLAILAAFCIFAASVLMDSALDKFPLDFFKRLRFLGGGYVSFCIVVGAVTTIIPMLYDAKRTGSGVFGWHSSFVLFVAAGVSVFMKMMTGKDKHIWIISMFVFYVFSIYALAKP